MTIGIDANEANCWNKVGISQYAYHLLKQMSAIGGGSYRLYLKKNPLPDMPKENKNWHYRIVGPKFLWTKIGLPLELLLQENKPDLFFSPTHYLPSWTPCPCAMSIMDLSYIYYPQLFRKKDLFQLTRWTRQSAAKASIIFTISHFTKKSILENYQIPEDKVIVTYPGYDKDLYNCHSIDIDRAKSHVFKKYSVKNDFLLYVGTIQPRKNLVRLIEAFEMIHTGNRKTDLVLVGKKGWLYEGIIERARKSSFAGNIRMLDFVSNDELKYFYRAAACFVLPSLYEGFGIPVIEAMACGCPVVISNVTSLPEIAGNCALSVNPLDSRSLVDAIQKVMTGEALKKTMVNRGLNRVKMFSWEKCARETVGHLDAFIKERVRK